MHRRTPFSIKPTPLQGRERDLAAFPGAARSSLPTGSKARHPSVGETRVLAIPNSICTRPRHCLAERVRLTPTSNNGSRRTCATRPTNPSGTLETKPKPIPGPTIPAARQHNDPTPTAARSSELHRPPGCEPGDELVDRSRPVVPLAPGPLRTADDELRIRSRSLFAQENLPSDPTKVRPSRKGLATTGS